MGKIVIDKKSITTGNPNVQLTDAVLGNHDVTQGNDGYSRVTVNSEVPLFKDLAILFRVLDDIASVKDALKKFRLTCREALFYAHDWYLKHFNVRLSPAFCEKTIDVSFEINERTFEFIKSNGFKCNLLLCCSTDLEAFRLLLSSKHMDEFIKKANSIERLEIGFLLDLRDKMCLRGILKIMSECPNTFNKLKSLKTTEFADFQGFSLPNSIEFFETCKRESSDIIDSEMSRGGINISSLPNLKSIIISGHNSGFGFVIKDLKNLQVIQFDELKGELYFEINPQEFPSLSSVVANGKQIFDKYKSIISTANRFSPSLSYKNTLGCN